MEPFTCLRILLLAGEILLPDTGPQYATEEVEGQDFERFELLNLPLESVP